MRACRASAQTALLLTANALAGPLGPAACSDAVAPLPPGAARFAPPPAYARWWAMVEECAGRTGDLAAYAWYVTPGDSVPYARDHTAEAYTDVAARRIVVAAGSRGQGPTIRHEMLHALLGPAYASGDLARQHPPAYFQDRCGGVVACYAFGCLDAGPAPAAAPTDAPTVPASALDLALDVVPSPASRTGADSTVSVVVRVTNPTAAPAWASLEPSPDLPAPYVRWFGFRITAAGGSVTVPGLVQSDTTRRVPFAAGQTRRFVFDVNAAPYPVGDYTVTGVFNTRHVSAPLRVAP